MSTAKRRRSCSPPANRLPSCSPPPNRQRVRSPPPTASSPYFPPELIPEVAGRLTSLQDFFALRASCRAYGALLPLTTCNLASQAPLLLASTGSIPISYRLAICETEYMFPRGPPTRTSFSILHLLTGERTCVSSPPDPVFRVLLFGDLVLSLNWNQPQPQAIQYCHLEAADWRVAVITQPYSLVDLLYVNGVLYALAVGDLGSRLAVVELSENEGSVELVFLGGCWDDKPWAHLAECCGELLLVELVESEERMYRVFQWKFGEARWARLTNLGG